MSQERLVIVISVQSSELQLLYDMTSELAGPKTCQDVDVAEIEAKMFRPSLFISSCSMMYK